MAELLTIGIALLVFGIIILVNTLKNLKWHIDFQKKENTELRKRVHELELKVIRLEGKTNSLDIQINGVKFNSDINGTNLRYLFKVLGK